MGFYDRFLVRGKPTDPKINNSDWVYGVLDIVEVMPNPIGAGIDLESQNLYRITRRKPNFSADWNLPYPQEHIFVKYGTIGKYTLTDDMEGTKVFEGDIIEYEELDYNYTALVFYSKRYGSWMYVTEYGFRQELCWIHNFKVIGNFYDNPEMLNKYMMEEIE